MSLKSLVHLRPDELTPNPLNPRGPVHETDPGMEELIGSVREKGVLQPLVITPQKVIVIGHRRHKAAEKCDALLPCIIREYDEVEQQEIMLIENLQREDLDPLREGLAFLRLSKTGLNYHDIARRVGVPAIRVSDRILITNFPSDIAALFQNLELPVSAAGPLSKIESEDDLRRIAGMVVSRRLPVKRIEVLVKDLKRKPGKKTGPPFKSTERPRGIVRDELVNALTERREDVIKIDDLIRELDFVCCACGMNATEASRASLCSACPLAAFLNRFALIPVKEGTPSFDLMAQTAPGAAR